MKKTLNDEVGMRLLKGLDLAFVVSFTFVSATLTLARADDAAAISAGFFALLLTFLMIYVLRSLGCYEPRQLARFWPNLARTWGVALILGVACLALSHPVGLALSGAWFQYWIAFAAVYFFATRLTLWPNCRKASLAGSHRERIAIVGGGKAAEDAITTLENSKGLAIEIVGLFDDRFDNRSPSSVRRHKKLGKIVDLATFSRANPIDLIIVAIPMTAEARLLQILKRIWELPVDIRVSGQATELKLAPNAYSYLGDLPLLSVFDRPLNPWNQFLKDVLDRGIALLAIIVLSPIMAAVALAVRMESTGPAIFKQKRFGFNNELIEVFKFRSMFVDRSDANAARLVTKGDPRVTRVGRFIRKTSLDELPQLFNVLNGQLSLVGPRPHATQAKAAGGLYEEVVEGYFARHKVKPGITGWAQINGWRGETDTVEKIAQRVNHDLEYINRWSLGFDFYILMKTPFALLKSENAY